MQNGNTRLEATSFYKFTHLQTNSTAFENTPPFSLILRILPPVHSKHRVPLSYNVQIQIQIQFCLFFALNQEVTTKITIHYKNKKK